MSELPAAAQRVQAALAAGGVDTTVVVHEQSARTAEEAASAVGADVGQIVKSLVFAVDGVAVLCLVSGRNQLDTDKLAALAGGPVERADAVLVRDATGYAIGGVSPLAHPRPLAIWCDEDLLTHDVVWAAAGTPHAVFPITPAELVRVSGAQVADLAR